MKRKVSMAIHLGETVLHWEVFRFSFLYSPKFRQRIKSKEIDPIPALVWTQFVSFVTDYNQDRDSDFYNNDNDDDNDEVMNDKNELIMYNIINKQRSFDPVKIDLNNFEFRTWDEFPEEYLISMKLGEWTTVMTTENFTKIYQKQEDAIIAFRNLDFNNTQIYILSY